MKTNLQIAKQAAEITLTKKSLWLLGIFLSSGFNLHAWFGWQWFSQSGLFGVVREWQSSLNVWYGGVLFGLGLVLALIIVNFLKLWFFTLVHNYIHDLEIETCFLCKRLKDQTVGRFLKQSYLLLAKTILASLVTIFASISVVSLFHFYSSNSDFSFLKAFLLMGSLIVILIGISWWNMLTVLFMLWYEQNLTRAAGLAVDLLTSKIWSLLSVTFFATVLFLVSIAAGGLVLFQLPALLASSPNYLFYGEAFNSWQTMVSIISAGLFLFWLILNNVWFNVVMIIMFDQLVSGKKDLEPERATLFTPSHSPAGIHHYIDKNP